GKLALQRILLIGAGETATLVAKALAHRHVRELYVAARRFQRARQFTHTVGGVPLAFRKALAHVAKVDAVIVASSAPHYVITARHVQRLCRDIPAKPLLLDLSTPANIDPQVAALPGVELRTLEDLRQIVEVGLRQRQRHVQAAEELVKSRLSELKTFFLRLRAEPAIGHLYRQAEQIRQLELSRALTRLNGLPPEAVRTIETLTHSIVEGILARPTSVLRRAATAGDEQTLNLGQALFGSGDGKR
ncbi:MAG: hypothetical protein ACREU7_16465, partial [Burkholderiales bacterium]